MRKGDPIAQKIVDEYIHYLSEGIVNMINIFQPDILCIGGGISKLHTDILLAHFDLVFDTFSFPCKFGFSGVDYELSVDFHLCHLIMLYILKYCIIASTIHQ